MGGLHIIEVFIILGILAAPGLLVFAGVKLFSSDPAEQPLAAQPPPPSGQANDSLT